MPPKLSAKRLFLHVKNVKLSKQMLTLSNVNVLDVTRIVAGPFCSMMLGDLGANVIKVESLEGDESRKWGPPFLEECNDSHYFLAVNRNKKSICLDFKSKIGKEVFYDLTKKCDVVMENFRPGKLDELQVGYKKLKTIKPDIIYCAVTGYGDVGPYRERPGYDVIAAAMGGLMHVTGEKDGGPVKVGVAITDLTTGLHAFGAIMTALYHRSLTGEGQKIDCNLLSTQISNMINVASCYLNGGIEPRRWGTEHSNLVPYQAFKTKSGYLVLGTGSDAQFRDLCRRIDRSDLADDSRFKTNRDRVTNRDILIHMLQETMAKQDNKHWCKVFADASFPHGPINTMSEVFEDEHVKAIGLVKELPHPLAGSVKVVAPPTVYEKTTNQVRSAPPLIGQHTKEILANFLNYDEQKIQELFEKKIVK